MTQRIDATMTEVSVVIVTWNTKEIACECLDSLRQCQGISLQVIVVDNASSDGTPDAIAEKYPEVTLIRNKVNLGFAAANNIGIRLSAGKYVCLVNSDVIVPPTCLAKMIEYMEAQTTIGVLGPKMRLPDGSIGDSCMRFPSVANWFGRALALDTLFKPFGWFGGFLMTDFRYDHTRDVDILTGWFWMVRREALNQAGLLDERFFMYGEDIEWCRRFHEFGWRVVFFADAEAIHHCRASSAKAPVRFYLEEQRANMQYVEKYHSRLGQLGFGIAVGVNELIRAVGYSLAYFIRPASRTMAAHKVKRSLACLRWLATATSSTGAELRLSR